MEIDFLSIDDVKLLHADQLALYGGLEGVRDEAMLDLAIYQAQSAFSGKYLHAFPFGMAAAYLYHIVMNHPFIDGNKRTGVVAALAFLDLNGIEIDAAPGEIYDLTIAVATSLCEKPEIAKFLANHRKQ